MKKTIQYWKDFVLKGGAIDAAIALELSSNPENDALYTAANEIRQHFCGNNFDLCAIANARSGRCSEDCKWCAQSVHYKTMIDEYEMIDEKEAIEQAVYNSKMGVHKFSLVTSGKKINPEAFDRILNMFDEIRKKTEIKLCASLGLIDDDALSKLKQHGVTCYHCNLETAPSYFSDLCTSHTTDEKIRTLMAARNAGLNVCSGGIIGMGESMEQRIEMALLLRKLDIKSIPINILHPIAGTPLENTTKLTDEEILTSIALFRFINPDAMIRFAGGRSLILHIQEKALKAGINAALVGDLLTTVGSKITDDIDCFRNAGFLLE